MKKYRTIKGFTLLELMITVVVIGILAAVALPSYQQYVLKSRRSVAKTFLLDIAAKQQQYLLDARTYATTVAALKLTMPSEIASFYNAPSLTDTCTTTNTPTAVAFCAQIAPKTGSGQEKDLSGATITIDQAGTKGPSAAWQ